MPVACELSLQEVQGAFFAAPPAIAKQIEDRSIVVPSFLGDLPRMLPWENGTGTSRVKYEFRGEMPPIEDGFASWRTVGNQQGCDPCPGTGCGYNYTQLKGYGFNQKVITIMEKELISEAFCIKDIQNTAQFEEVFTKLVENLEAQVRFYKEINVVDNYLNYITQKFVVDSEGIKINRANPFTYPTIGSATLSSLNPNIMKQFYEWMKIIPGVEPFGTQNGAPFYAMTLSADLLESLYRQNPTLREDIRFSGLANDLITKYNFVSTIQGMFIPVTIQWPRRYNIVNGEPYRVLPFLNGIPANYGSFTDFNPAYMTATHEEVRFFGRFPFNIHVKATETSLPGGASFGPEPKYFDGWQWFNPKTPEDPFGRVGWFVSAASIGLESDSDGSYALLVKRPPQTSLFTFYPNPELLPDPVTPTNVIPASGCPCPLSLSVTKSLFDADTYTIVFSAPIDAEEEDTIQLALQTGGYSDAEVVRITEDGLTVEVTSSDDLSDCIVIGVFCDDSLGCSATVVGYSPECTDATRLGLRLSNPIKAVTPGDVVTIQYGDGSTASVTVVTANMVTNIWVIDVGSTAFCDKVGGVLSLCVPSSTDPTCPGCGPITYTQCS